MKKYFYLIVAIFFAACLYLWNRHLLTSTAITLPKAQTTENIMLVPLDSRPVSTRMVQKLGHIAGLNVILPPKTLLDNYQKSADKEKLALWLKENINKQCRAIISADLLLHGSLLEGRQDTASPEEQSALIDFFKELHAQSDCQTDIFSIIPRLLVSDQLLPDSWYQYHLMRYSELTDMVEISSDYLLTEELLAMKERIPPAILGKYIKLYACSTDFNLALLNLADVKTNIIIGQDDTLPLGLPQGCARKVRQYLSGKNLYPYAAFVYGADEIATLLLARNSLALSSEKPKIFFHYANPKIKFTYMPYMAASVSAILLNQMELLGLEEISDEAKADIIFYINCGSDKFRPGEKETAELEKLLAGGKKVALVDLSSNFEAEELLMPKLLKKGVAVHKLTAFAGWNTFSNSSGTAFAQAILFYQRLKQLENANAPQESIAAIYADNLRFTLERILDDFFYQKKLHAKLRKILMWQWSDSYNLTEEEKTELTRTLQADMSFAAEILLRKLCDTPFYANEKSEYYLRELCVGAKLPWNRIFEVELNIHTSTGVKRNK